jgi:1,4-alpha-glucan branching enzyme
VQFFHFHPSIDDNDGIRTFAYCRTGGKPLGSSGQVAVLANAGPHDFPSYEVPWPWTDGATERGKPPSGSLLEVRPDLGRAVVSLAPFQVRVFAT